MLDLFKIDLSVKEILSEVPFLVERLFSYFTV